LVNEFQKRLVLIVATLAVVVTVDAVFAHPHAFETSSHGGGQVLTGFAADAHR
jgi:hypothetical protein